MQKKTAKFHSPTPSHYHHYYHYHKMFTTSSIRQIASDSYYIPQIYDHVQNVNDIDG